MSSPAELLAAAHAAAAVSNDSSVASAAHSSVGSPAAASPATPASPAATPAPSSAAVPSLNDEEAFPALGTAPVATTTTQWGPRMQKKPFAAAAATSKSPSPSPSSSSTFSIPMRSRAVQEAFSLDFENQLNINRSEIASILNSLKKSTKCNIECTSSQQTRKRTFLITGEPSAIATARKEIIRRLTKPVRIDFVIPASTRAIVIGQGGRTLKPILEANGVKINIDHNTTDPGAEDSDSEFSIFGTSSKVSIEGDIQGANDAKAQILAIVDQHTKTVSTKLKVDPSVAPLLEREIKQEHLFDSDLDLYVSPSGLVTLSGPREAVVDLRAKVKSLAADLSSRVTAKEQVVPKKFHKFIDTDEIANDLNVVVEIPFEEDDSELVRFVGDKDKLDAAIAKAKQSSKKHSVESLNIAKAHKGDLAHAKNLGVYLKHTSALDPIAQDFGIQVFLPSYDTLLAPATKDVTLDFVFDKNVVSQDTFKAAKKQVINLVNELPPAQTRAIAGVDAFFAEQVAKHTEELAAKHNVTVIPFGTLKIKSNTKSNTILLVYTNNDDEDDFGPSADEIKEKFDEIEDALNQFRELSKDVVTESLDIPSKEQEHIVGPKEATLRSLKAAAKNPLDIFLHSPSEDQVTLHGLKSDVALISKEIAQVIQDAKDYAVASAYSTTLSFPSSVLSRLIGKNGAHLNTLSEEYGVKVDVDQSDAANASATVNVKITGIKRNAEEAKTKIQQLGKKWADETNQSLKVPTQYQRRLIGPKRDYINRLQDKYSVRIRTPHENDDSVKKDEFVIRGPSKGVKKAYDELKELLTYEIENGHKSTIQVPSNTVARIIGKNGDNLTALCDEYGVEIDVSDKKEDDDKSLRQVEITGSKSSIKEVEAKIKSIVKDIENTVTVQLDVDPKYYGSILGTNGANLRSILAKAKAPEDSSTWRRLLVIPDRGAQSKTISSTGDKKIVDSIISQIKEIVAKEESSVTEEISLAQEKHRLLIGPGGSIRRNIESEFGVALIIPRVQEHSDIIKIRGQQADVLKVKEHITKLTADNWSALVEVPAKYHGALAQRGAVFKKLKNEFNTKVEHGQFTRQASRLSSAAPTVAVPESAQGPAEDSSASFKWTVVEDTTDPVAAASSTAPGVEPETATGASAGAIPWRLVGTPEDTLRAKEYLEAQLANIKSFNATGFLWVQDRSKFSRVIGPSGATVERVRRAAGVNVTIPKAGDAVNDVIVVRGSVEGVEKAKKEILKLIT